MSATHSRFGASGGEHPIHQVRAVVRGRGRPGGAGGLRPGDPAQPGAAHQHSHPGDATEHWDLWDGSLPDFRLGARAKMTVFGGGEPAGAEGAAWRAARRAFERFDAADRLLFSVPMWNASIPYVLKQFIDVVSQPGWIFDVDPSTGYRHLLADRGKRVAVIYTSAVWGPELARSSAPTSNPHTSTTGCAGPASPTSARSGSTRPCVVTAIQNGSRPTPSRATSPLF